MLFVNLLEFYCISLCVNVFALFTYLFFYISLITNTQNQNLFTEYDFVIIGSGTAGSLIAHRLATETNYTFIVLEAGGKSSFIHEIPAFGPLLHSSVFDWQYETVPQENACFAMENHRCKQTQGKIFGGSYKLNNMIHVRGNITHFVNWFRGKYSEEMIEKQFCHIEKSIIKLSEMKYQSKLSQIFLDAAKELGYKRLKEHFSEGFMKAKVSQDNGKRWTTSDNIFDHVITNVLVEKVLIENDKCVGIQLYPDSKKIYARKGVIITAGTFNTAKILQLSGIGPAELLQSLNITVLKDLPVGKNLQDHVGTGFDLLLFDKLKSVGPMDIINPISVFKYFVNGDGPFTTPGGEVLGFLATKTETIPDVQFVVMPVGLSTDRGGHLRKTLGITDDVWQNYFAKLFDKQTATVFTVVLHPKSKGCVNIQSKDPNVPPLIDPKYLSHTDDVQVLKNGLKMLIKFTQTKPMQEVGTQINNIPFPGCEHLDFFTDAYLECYIKHLTTTSFHPVGTCSMGSPDSNATVVDTSFKVLGIDNLYVADGSVLPTIPSGNINAAIAMMANIFFEYTIKKTKYPDYSCSNRDILFLSNQYCPVL